MSILRQHSIWKAPESAVTILLLLRFDGSTKHFWNILRGVNWLCFLGYRNLNFWETTLKGFVLTFIVYSKIISSLKTFIRKVIEKLDRWTTITISWPKKYRPKDHGLSIRYVHWKTKETFKRKCLSKLTSCFKILTAAELRSLSHDSFFKK